MRGAVNLFAGLFLLGGVMLGSYLGALHLSGNFHEVVAGRFYRSGQLSPATLARYIERYDIKTVINLRGPAPGRVWYEEELTATRNHGAEHIDFQMSAGRKLTVEQSFQLVALMRNASGPILVHCQGGSDRSGLASVLYLQQIAGADEKTAEWQLSPLYGHINLPFLYAYAMDDSWEAFEKAIRLRS
ncbi:protein tyrosine phosphatase [Neorhizobium lilium]|uniref:Protein tyrosine phosphatase n=1 Tax=Neorhizobium lilium TaxID=2503024 RepID=A0A3S3RR51_9HYPH|nr:tyrosine-protein phosphatase [Neorhizobium lilium]RWX75884.1 protein tyrosine phosphatase [Neorhizobium lilium]